MASQRYLIIREGYVINAVIIDADAVSEYSYPLPHDSIVHDADHNVGIGDWYEESEKIFYRPLKQPSDLPTELLKSVQE